MNVECIKTVGELKQLINDLSSDIKISICGCSGGFIHIDLVNNIIIFDTDNLIENEA